MACLGIPALVIVRAPNQWRNAELLDRTGAAVCLGAVETLAPEVAAARFDELADPRRRERMRQRARDLVDGGGARRVAEELLR